MELSSLHPILNRYFLMTELTVEIFFEGEPGQVKSQLQNYMENQKETWNAISTKKKQALATNEKLRRQIVFIQRVLNFINDEIQLLQRINAIEIASIPPEKTVKSPLRMGQ